MRSTKRYTNTTFTKRVDHAPEPYEQPTSASAVCEICGAVYANRRWSVEGTPAKKGKRGNWQPASRILCPACKQKTEGVPGGYVYLEGRFIDSHRDDIEGLLRNEAERAAIDNPLARIITWQRESPANWTITTTTEHLAQRLGHALEKAFDGEVRYDFSHENKLARVWWHRD